MTWYLSVLKNYTVFKGRARRKEYWMFTLVDTIISLILDGITATTHSTPANALELLYGLAVLLPGLAVLVRRLHDIGKSGGWFWIVFIPFVGAIWLLVLTATNGDPGPNQYGPDPKTTYA